MNWRPILLLASLPALLATSLIPLALFAQEPTLEIRGAIAEYLTAAPLPGVEVTVSEFVIVDRTRTRKPITSVFTDEKGAYRYQPGHVGSFFLEAKREGYKGFGGLDGVMVTPAVSIDYFELTEDDPKHSHNFVMFRPATLAGRIVDENDQPIPNLALEIVPPIDPPYYMPTRVITGPEGSFRLDNVSPGRLLIHVMPPSQPLHKFSNKFKPEDVDGIDEDYETGYYPGGRADYKDALPLELLPGVMTDAGTIRLRKVSYYRALLTFDGDCSRLGSWTVFEAALSTQPPATMFCEKRMLLGMLPPGRTTLRIITQTAQWAAFDVEIRDHNVTVPITFRPAVSVPIRVVLADGTPPPRVTSVHITLDSLSPASGSPKADGSLLLKAFFPPQHIFVDPPSDLDVREIRYGHVPLPDTLFAATEGVPLEIVVDDHPVSLDVTVRERGRAVVDALVLAARWPLSEAAVGLYQGPPYVFFGTTRQKGQGRLTSLAEGEYRVIALPPDSQMVMMTDDKLVEFLERAKTVKLEPTLEPRSLEIELSR